LTASALRVTSGNLYPQAHPLTALEGEQVDDDLEAFGRHSFGQRSIGVAQIVDGAQVRAHLKACIAERSGHLEITLARDVDHLLARPRRPWGDSGKPASSAALVAAAVISGRPRRTPEGGATQPGRAGSAARSIPAPVSPGSAG